MRSTRLALLALAGLLPAVLTCGGGDSTGPSVPAGLSRVSGHGQSAAAGQALASPLVVKVVDGSGAAVQGVAVAWVVASGGGSLSPTSSLTDAQGLASTTWTLGPSVGLHSAIASIAGNVSIAPVSFAATAQAGSATKLTFTVQPSAVAVGAAISPAVQVTVQDALGNTVTSATTSIALAVTSGTGTSGAALAGTLTRAAVAGVASFADLTVSMAGTGYTLTATATSLTSAVSTAFTVSGPLTTMQAVPSTAGTVNTPIPTFTPVTASGGTLPYTFALSGATLPTGMAFSTSTGAVSGTPTTTLAATVFTVTVTDAVAATSAKTFTLTVNAALTTTQAVPTTAGTVNTPIPTFTPVTASGGTLPYAFALSGGTLPTGMAFSTSTGAVSGTPTTALVATVFSVTVTDAATATSAKTFTLTVNGALTTTQAVPSTTGVVNALIPTFTPVTASGGTLPYTFALSGATLPTGMAFSPSTGAVSGTPTTPLAATVFTVTVTDAAAATSAKTFTLTVNGPLTTTQAVPTTTGTANTLIPTFTPVTAAGGTLPYAFALSGGTLPTGMSFSTSTGAVSGTPTTALAATVFTVTVTDAAAATSAKTFTLTVNDALTTTQAAPTTTGTVNTLIPTFTPVTASGGTLPYTFALSGATLPTGMAFSPSTGAVTGTPTTILAATVFTVTVTDAAAATSAKTFTLTVNPALTTTQAVPSKAGTVNTLIPTYTPVTASGGTLPYAFALSGGTLPTGMAFSPSTGAVSGTPTTTLAATVFTVTVTDAAAATSAKTFTLTVNDALTTTQAVPSRTGVVNTLIPTFTPVTASGGTLPYAFALSGGTLPTGMAFSTSTGAVSGTPTTTLAATVFTVTVTDAAAATSAKTFTLTVTEALVYDGLWAGRTGLDSTITLSISNNRITQVSFGWGGISACGGTVSGRTTSNFTPGISVTSGSFTTTTSASPITYTLSGTFSSATAVSGSLSVSFSQPCGSGSRSTTWSATLAGAPGVPAKLGFTVQPSAVVAGASISPAVQVSVQDALGNTVTSATASITLAITSGTGPSGAALGGTLTRAAVAGVATFDNLTIDKAGTGFTLTATAAGLASATSSALAVSPGAPAKLVFTVHPSDAIAGVAISPAVQVTVQDAFGNTVTSATTSIALAITSGTGTSGAALGGTPTRAAVAGVASFTDLTVDLAGTGYTLTATATSLTSATSSAFEITAVGALRTTQAVPSKTGTLNTLIPTFTPVTASGGTLPYTFALSGATLPTGMSFSTSTGAVSGTPTTTLAATVFTVTVTDAVAATSAKTFTLTVNDALTTTQAVPTTSGTANTLIPTFTPVTASGGTLPYTFALSGGTLPTGMAFSTSTGAVSGTPTTTLAATVFTVTVRDAAAATSAKTFTLTVDPDPRCAYALATPVTAGQTVNGTLAAGDCLISGKYTDQYALTLTGTTNIQVELTSATFDTYLRIVDATTSALVTYNDDDALSGTYNSRVNLPLTARTYIIQATSYSTGVTGAYQLRVCASAPTQIALGQTLNGTLESSDCGLAATGDGIYIDRFQFTLTQPTTVTLTETSADFDAYLWLFNSTETSILASDDDGAGGSDARIVMAGGTVLQPGTYIAWPSSYFPAATGAYQFSLTGATDYCSIASAISNPQTVSGELTTADCLLSDGSYADRWQITLAAPTALRIDMTSTAFDAFLFMRDASGNTVASDDDAGGGTNARIEGTFAAGTYIIWANSFLPAATGAYGLAVSTAPAATVNLRIDQLYLVQGTQAFNGSVPLVSGRDALLRVFVRADQANTVAPEVRVRTYISGVLQNTRTIPAPGASVPTVLNEGSLTSSWNVLIPAAEMQPGAQILADVDPTNAIAEGNEGDNTYPASGTPMALDVRTMPTFYITLVPIAQSANGLTGNVTAGNQDSFLNLTRRMWPFATVSPVVHSTYTTTTPGALLSDGTNWSPVLSELRALRTVEASSRHYFGVVKVSYTSGVAGLGYIGLPTAMGWDYLPSGDGTLAHELGHNFDRLHAPCGGPAGPDPYYPYAAGAIGVYGYDVAGATLKARTMPDLMSYCHPEWISDYTFRGALDFIVANPTSPTVAADPAPGILIWGRVDNGTLVLEPAIDVTAVPSPLPPSGPYRLEGTDASGRTILNLSFAPEEVADAPTPTRHFAFVIPKSSLRGAGLSALQLTGPDGASASLRSSGATDNAALVDAATTATRRPAGLVEVRWDATRYPLAVVRSTVTGEILSFARGGLVSVPDAGAEIEVVVSDGVRSAVRRLVPGR